MDTQEPLSESFRHVEAGFAQALECCREVGEAELSRFIEYGQSPDDP